MSQVKELIQKGIQKSLEEQQVPLHLHLKVVKALSESMKNHEADLTLNKKEQLAHVTQLKSITDAHTQEKDSFLRQIGDYQQEITRLQQIDHLKGEPGKPGETGQDGIAPSIEDIIDAIKPLIPEPIPGKDGENAVFDEEAFLTKVVDHLRKKKPLDISHIQNAQTFIKDGIRYRVEELMHGAGSGGSNTGTAVYNEVVAGSGTAWTLINVPTTGTLRLYANGQRLIPGAGNDYTLSGGNITTALSWSAGTLIADYNHA